MRAIIDLIRDSLIGLGLCFRTDRRRHSQFSQRLILGLRLCLLTSSSRRRRCIQAIICAIEDHICNRNEQQNGQQTQKAYLNALNSGLCRTCHLAIKAQSIGFV
ncbi:MAG: hypothetical protein WA793_13470, partial [Sphingorhabdus sp.]